MNTPLLSERYTQGEAGKVLRALSVIAASPAFVRSGRMIRFLDYIVNESLSVDAEVSERQIAEAVFDRGGDWDPKLDPIVRIEARRLRTKLDQFYRENAPAAEVVISIPKGGYLATFTFPEVVAATPAPAALEAFPAAEHAPVTAGARLPTAALRWGLLLALCVLVMAGIALWSESSAVDIRQDRPLLILPFKMESAQLPERDGAALAGKLADEIRRLQSETRITWKAQTVDDVWTAESEPSWPRRLWHSFNQAAQSENELFRQRVRVSGSLEQTNGTVNLYLRSPSLAPVSFRGEPVELPALLRLAAEHLYGESQPVAYSVFLVEQHRFTEAIAFASRKLASTNAVGDRGQLLFSWANALASLGRSNEAIEKMRAAMDLHTQCWGCYTALAELYLDSGQPDQAFETGLLLERASHRGSWLYAHLPARFFRPVRPDVYIPIDLMRRDYGALRRAIEQELAVTAGEGTHVERLEAAYASILISLHDRRKADIELEVAEHQETNPVTRSQMMMVRMEMAKERNDQVALQRLLDNARTHILEQSHDPALGSDFTCSIGPAYERIGDHATANLLLHDAPGTLDCLLAKAETEALRGNTTQAQSLFLKARSLAPRLPAPAFSYGEFLLRSGSAGEAKKQFRLAGQLGPNWAEPQEAMGRQAASEGDLKAADAFLAKAASLAPAWGQCLIEWGYVLARMGRTKEAAARYSLAGALELTPAESARLPGKSVSR